MAVSRKYPDGLVLVGRRIFIAGAGPFSAQDRGGSEHCMLSLPPVATQHAMLAGSLA